MSSLLPRMSAMFYYLSGQLGRHTEKREGLSLLYRAFVFKNSVGILAYNPIITKFWVFRFPKKMYHSRLRYLARYSLHYAILESPARSYMKWVRFSFVARNLLLSWDSAAVAFTELWVIHVRKCQKHKHCVRLAAGERNKQYTSSLIQNTINTEAAPGLAHNSLCFQPFTLSCVSKLLYT